MFRIAICDNNKEVVKWIGNMLEKYKRDEEMDIQYDIFESGKRLIKSFELEKPYDLLFLNIDIKELDGIEIGKIIRNRLSNYWTQIVFFSDQDLRVKELFDINTLNFLEKPLEAEHIYRQVNRAIKLLNGIVGYFQFKVNGEMHRIEVSKIIYFKSDKRRIRLITYSDDIYFYEKLSNVEERLKNYNSFLRISQSILVNYSAIICIKNGFVELKSGKILPVSKNYHKNVELFFDQMMSQ